MKCNSLHACDLLHRDPASTHSSLDNLRENSPNKLLCIIVANSSNKLCIIVANYSNTLLCIVVENDGLFV